MGVELKIKQVTIPEVIEFNYEELKGWLTEKAKDYETVVYTDENIADAKKDRAAINKFIKTLNQARIEKKKEFLVPYTEFEVKIKELEGILEEPLHKVDEKIKSYEAKIKAKKVEEIKKIWDKLEKPEWLQCNQIFDKKWLNATVSLSSIESQLAAKVLDITNKVEWIKSFDWSFETMALYKKSLNVETALETGKKLWELNQAKNRELADKGILRAEVPRVEENEAKRFNIKFEAELTMAQAKQLKAFCDNAGIILKKI